MQTKTTEGNIQVSGISMKDLLESGAHFGHRVSNWDSRMARFIFTKRKGVHIIDLQKTVAFYEQAYNYVRNVAANGGKVLFVGTKKQAKKIVEEAAQGIGAFYITNRWISGLLTNFQTVRKSLKKLEILRDLFQNEEKQADFIKRDIVKKKKKMIKLEEAFGGILEMKKFPDLIFVVDAYFEKNCIREANLVGIPVCAVVDTNSNPDNVDVVIPANDDAIRSISLFVDGIAGAFAEGSRMYQSIHAEEIALASEGQDVMEEKDFLGDGDKKKDIVDKDAILSADLPEKKEKIAEKPELKAKPEATSSAISAQSVKELRESTNVSMMECKKALVASKGDFEGAVRFLKEKGLSLVEKKSSREAKEGIIALAGNHQKKIAIKVLCETDFVAKNETFVSFADDIAKSVLLGDKNSADDEAIQSKIADLTVKLGEKIVVGSFEVIESKKGYVSAYLHSNKKIAVMVELAGEKGAALESSDALSDLGQDLAMQIAAMDPLSISSADISEEVRQKEKEILIKQMEKEDKPANIKEKMIEGKLTKYFAERCLLDMNFVKQPKVKVGDHVDKVSKDLAVSIVVKNFKRLSIG